MKKWFLRLAPLVLALVMVCGSCLTVFASVYSYPVDEYEYYVCFYHGNHGVEYFLCSNEQPFYVIDDSGTLLITTDGEMVVYQNGSYWDTYPHTSIGLGSWDTMYFEDAVTSHDIYLDDGTIFFQVPPDPPTLAPIAETAGMSGVLEQLMMILPIGLVCLVGWIALRKALAILPRILHQA